MKTTMTKIALLGIAGAIAFALCSFKNEVRTTTVNTKTIAGDEWAEWYEVRDFVKENIQNPIAAVDKENARRPKMEYYSRCPSGYNSTIAGKRETVKKDTDVFGTIVLYKGCSSKHICDYKVCVDKKIALVKNKGEEEYITVKEWLAKKETVTTTTKNTTAVKG
jgi:hypothetical protein